MRALLSLVCVIPFTGGCKKCYEGWEYDKSANLCRKDGDNWEERQSPREVESSDNSSNDASDTGVDDDGSGSNSEGGDEPRTPGDDGDSTDTTDGDSSSLCGDADIILDSVGATYREFHSLSWNDEHWDADCTPDGSEDERSPVDTFTLCAEVDIRLNIYMSGYDTGGGDLDDPVLYLFPFEPTVGSECVESDDDGGEGEDAAIDLYNLFEGRVVWIMATTNDYDDVERYGSYQLRIDAD